MVTVWGCRIGKVADLSRVLGTAFGPERESEAALSVALHDQKPVSAVDVFCGVGGLTHGLLKEGINVCAGIDIDPKCRYPYEKNNACLFVEEDVAKLSGLEVASFFPLNHTKILVGCAPCQPFSTYTRGKKERKLHKWGLLSAFGRIIREADPDIVSMENVPQLEKETNLQEICRQSEVLRIFRHLL